MRDCKACAPPGTDADRPAGVPNREPGTDSGDAYGVWENSPVTTPPLSRRINSASSTRNELELKRIARGCNPPQRVSAIRQPRFRFRYSAIISAQAPAFTACASIVAAAPGLTPRMFCARMGLKVSRFTTTTCTCFRLIEACFVAATHRKEVTRACVAGHWLADRLVARSCRGGSHVAPPPALAHCGGQPPIPWTPARRNHPSFSCIAP
jgi:hypothetical protein